MPLIPEPPTPTKAERIVARVFIGVLLVFLATLPFIATARN